MISPTHEAISGGIQIGRLLVQSVSRGPIAQWNGDRHLEPVEEMFLASQGIE